MTADALDITVILILLISMGIAWFRGLIREVFTIISLFGSSYAAYKGGPLLLPRFNEWLHVPVEVEEGAADAVAEKAEMIWGVLSPELAAKLASYSSAFLFFFIVMTLIGFFLSRAVNEAGLGVVDKVLGAGFGFARGFLLIFLIYFGCTYLIDQEKMPKWVAESKSYPVFEEARVWANKRFSLEQKVEDRGDGIAIHIDKVTPDEEDMEKAEDAARDLMSGERFDPFRK